MNPDDAKKLSDFLREEAKRSPLPADNPTPWKKSGRKCDACRTESPLPILDITLREPETGARKTVWVCQGCAQQFDLLFQQIRQQEGSKL